MKERLIQISILGGFYLVISLFLSFFNDWFLAIADVILFFVLIILAAILLFIQPVNFIRRFRVFFPKISLYFVCVGWVAYLSLPVLILGAVEGYNATFAEYQGLEYNSYKYNNFMQFFNLGYIGAIMVSFITATFLVIRKSKQKA